jgi:transcriptional regulator with GAF, ATPase, and Fis domain
VHMPPLRERGDDVLLLAEHFIRALSVKMGMSDITLSRPRPAQKPSQTVS